LCNLEYKECGILQVDLLFFKIKNVFIFSMGDIRTYESGGRKNPQVSSSLCNLEYKECEILKVDLLF